jgi:hypothetical protein
MEAVPLHLRQANEFIAQHHRHNLPAVGCKWAIGATLDGTLVGVAIVGRPICRRLDDGQTLEILRVATDGTANVCSFLYGRCARIARLMGYERIITYTLESEGGASLRAVGARPTGPLKSHEWSNPNRPRKRSQKVYAEPKYRWEL